MTYITIYFGDKPVYLCDGLNNEIEEIRHHPDAVFIDELSGSAIKSLFHEIQRPQYHAGILLYPDFKKLKKTFFKQFKNLQTGGGIVENEGGETLLIFRRGKWDLPKGKLDKGETLEECALREVKEETGLTKLSLSPLHTITYHTYEEFGKKILKESYWYKMKASGDERLVPQTEEDITSILWVKKQDINKYLPGAYPTIQSILKSI